MKAALAFRGVVIPVQRDVSTQRCDLHPLSDHDPALAHFALAEVHCTRVEVNVEWSGQRSDLGFRLQANVSGPIDLQRRDVGTAGLVDHRAGPQPNRDITGRVSG